MWIRVFNITWIQTETGNTSLLVTTAASKIIAKSSVVYILSLTWSPQVLCSEVHSLLSPPEMMYLTEVAWLWAQMREELRSALQEDLKWLVISYKPSPFFLWRDWRENSTFQAINLLLSRRKRQVTVQNLGLKFDCRCGVSGYTHVSRACRVPKKPIKGLQTWHRIYWRPSREAAESQKGFWVPWASKMTKYTYT